MAVSYWNGIVFSFSMVVPVRMFWKASSTLLASSAEVSMKESPLSPAECQLESLPNSSLISHTCELFGLLSWDSPQVPQIALVTNQHDNNVGISMVPQLL